MAYDPSLPLAAQDSDNHPHTMENYEPPIFLEPCMTDLLQAAIEAIENGDADVAQRRVREVWERMQMGSLYNLAEPEDLNPPDMLPDDVLASLTGPPAEFGPPRNCESNGCDHE